MQFPRIIIVHVHIQLRHLAAHPSRSVGKVLEQALPLQFAIVQPHINIDVVQPLVRITVAHLLRIGHATRTHQTHARPIATHACTLMRQRWLPERVVQDLVVEVPDHVGGVPVIVQREDGAVAVIVAGSQQWQTGDIDGVEKFARYVPVVANAPVCGREAFEPLNGAECDENQCADDR